MTERRGFSLEGDVAIITGGAQGIGEATARLFAERGANVVVADLNSDLANEVAESIREDGGAAAAFSLDVTAGEELDELIDFTDEAFGKLNHLVNNAGVAIDDQLAKQDDGAFDRTLAINLAAPRHLSRRAINYMLPKGLKGSITNASSTTAEFGLFSQTAYGSAKGGIETLTMALSREVGRKGIRVNAVAPGPVETAMLAQVPEAGIEAMKGGVALGRIAMPDEIASVYAFLASDEASFITGSVLKADGGYKKG